MGTRPGDGVYTLGLNSAMSILGQEAGHRWGAFVPFVHPTKGISFDSFDLLGRDFAHWSFFFNVRVPDGQFGVDPRVSSMEGNAIIDFGGNIFGDCRPGQTRFRTEANELVDGYTELDRYLMGLRRESAVGPFWYVDEPTQPSTGVSFEFIRGIFALDDIGICGKRVDLTVANIQAFPGVGPRVPAIGDEDDDGQGNDVTDHGLHPPGRAGYASITPPPSTRWTISAGHGSSTQRPSDGRQREVRHELEPCHLLRRRRCKNHRRK